MPLDEHEGIPARWLMVPAGVELELTPPPPAPGTPHRRTGDGFAAHPAACRHCGALGGGVDPAEELPAA
ncbi:hypothetical protein RVN83_25495 [Streptomyces sp. PU10]|uniref:hypothetical protein n=1 Tax=unclassified Streptomyces TaxID=2593676 RepID=UPI0028FC574A|nr:hypothetical protein [Streptomyces sp. PU10]MDU0256395.1 hypothetical protein [Streptomyces sp. PU10]